MVPQLRRSVRMHQTRASCKSKEKFVSQRVQNLKETVLDEAVWSRGLSDDIFCVILACLPLSSLFRLRCVSKKWNRIAQDPNFVNAYTRLSSQEACLFLASRDGSYWIYEHGLNSWKCVSPSFFCPKHLEGTWSPVAAVGSRLLLVRLLGPDSNHYSLVLYNPLNGMQEILPCPTSARGRQYWYLRDTISEVRVMHMPVDPYYRILLMEKKTSFAEDYDRERLQRLISSQVHLYDSRTSDWDRKEVDGYMHVLSVVPPVLSDEKLLYVVIGINLPFEDYETLGSILVYEVTDVPSEIDFESAALYGWDFDAAPQLCFPDEDEDLRFVAAHIFLNRGRLMFAAAMPFPKAHDKAIPKWKSIVIWEILALLHVGTQMVRVVEVDLKKFGPRISQGSFGTFLSKGDSLYFGSDSRTLSGIINISTKTWRLLPPCSGLVSHGESPATTRVFESFVYQPGFDLLAQNRSCTHPEDG